MFGIHRMDYVINEWQYKWTILQMNYRKMTISRSFSYCSFVIFHDGKKIGGCHSVGPNLGPNCAQRLSSGKVPLARKQ